MAQPVPECGSLKRLPTKPQPTSLSDAVLPPHLPLVFPPAEPSGAFTVHAWTWKLPWSPFKRDLRHIEHKRVQLVGATPRLSKWHFRQLLRLKAPAHKPGQEREQQPSSCASRTSGDIAIPRREPPDSVSFARKPELEAIDEEPNRIGTSIALSATSQPSLAVSTMQQSIETEPASLGNTAGDQSSPCRGVGDHNLSTSGLPADQPSLGKMKKSSDGSHCPVAHASFTQSRLYQLEKGLYKATFMEVPAGYLTSWKTLRWRLDDTLRNLFKPEPGLDPSASIELAMAGLSHKHIRPCVIIVCYNVPHQKQIQRILRE